MLEQDATQVEPSPTTQDVSAESSTAQVEDQNAFSAMEAALSGSDSEPTSDEPAAPAQEDAEAQGAGESEEEKDAKLPFHQHPRWQEVIAQRNEAREQLATIQAQVEQHREKVEQFDRISAYMEQARLSPDEVNKGYHIMALMKADPVAALRELAPYVMDLQRYSGDVLPDDLRREVDAGYITVERAKEIAMLRAGHTVSRQNAEAERAAREQRETANTRNAMIAVVNQLEQQWRTTTPDFDRVYPLLEAELAKLAYATPPKTADEARQLAETAKANVDRMLVNLLPKPTPMREPGATGRNPSNVIAQPKTSREAMELALRGEYPGA